MIRRNAKAINFGIIYGISSFGLARQLRCPQTEAKAYIDAYFMKYPAFKPIWIKPKLAREKMVLLKRFLVEKSIYLVSRKNPARRGFYERAAINAPIQGTAADIIKRAMIRIPSLLKEQNLNAKMLLTVHDELLFEVPTAQLDKTSQIISAAMEGAAAPAVEMSVPLVAEVGIGSNWAEAH